MTATRTWEGSAAVFQGSALALLLAACLPPEIVLPDGAAWKGPLLALACAALEALSPHGWDNFTLQVAPAAMAWPWMGAQAESEGGARRPVRAEVPDPVGMDQGRRLS